MLSIAVGSTEPSAASVSASRQRAGFFSVALILVMLVGDGWSGRPLGSRHQIILLPFTALFLGSLYGLLFSRRTTPFARAWTPHRALLLCGCFELLSLLLFVYEAHHFAGFGYRLRLFAGLTFAAIVFGLAAAVLVRGASVRRLLAIFVATYALGVLLAVVSFPLNYLRSDMLPVILWADRNLVHHVSPYATMFVGGRVYDFPYLPGVLVVFLPFVAAHVDLRFASILALDAAATLLFSSAVRARRYEVVCLLGLVLLDPFLQYRHDLYLQPHWLTLVGAFVLMQRGRWVWGAFVLGLGMAIYQFSWIVLPFVLLNALWRRGWGETCKLAGAAVLGALLLAGPFLHSAATRIASNTVGQWGHFGHAIADPMNVSYWLTYFVHPDSLLKIQAVLMVAIFVGCIVRRRCATLEDTLRWTVVALTVFILCNSLVDGYFFLMLLVPMLLFTLIANGWLAGPPQSVIAQADGL